MFKLNSKPHTVAFELCNFILVFKKLPALFRQLALHTIEDSLEIFSWLFDEETGRVHDEVASTIRSAVRDAFADWKPDLEKRVSTPDIHKPNVDDNVISPTSNVEESVTIQQPTPEKSLDIEMPDFQY